MCRDMLDTYERRLIWVGAVCGGCDVVGGRGACEVTDAHGISKSWIYVLDRALPGGGYEALPGALSPSWLLVASDAAGTIWSSPVFVER
jgi:hypothetical protein